MSYVRPDIVYAVNTAERFSVQWDYYRDSKPVIVAPMRWP